MRRLYLGPWRIDVEWRDDVPRLLPGVALARAAAAALDIAGAPSPASLGLILAGDRELAALNAEHMGKDGPTDVLSFPMLPPGSYPAHPGKGGDGAGHVRVRVAAGCASASRRHRDLGRAGDRPGRGGSRWPDG